MTQSHKRLLVLSLFIAVSIFMGLISGWLIGWFILVSSLVGVWMSSAMRRYRDTTRPFVVGLQGFAIVLLAYSIWGPISILLANFPLRWITFLAFEAIALAVALGIGSVMAFYAWLVSTGRVSAG